MSAHPAPPAAWWRSRRIYLHFHCLFVDADAAGDAVFHSASLLDAQAIAEVQAAVRRRLFRANKRPGLLPADDAQARTELEHGGALSVIAEVRIEAHEPDGLERLLRYFARPVFALEWLREIDPKHLTYQSVKPGPGGSVSRMLTPIQRIDRMAMRGWAFRFLKHQLQALISGLMTTETQEILQKWL